MGSGAEMTTAQYLIFMSPVVGTVLVVFGLKYFSAIFQAQARSASDAQYRALAEKSASAQADNQATLSAMRADLAKFATSLANVEKILQQVE
jgi:hypothetical protein